MAPSGGEGTAGGPLKVQLTLLVPSAALLLGLFSTPRLLQAPRTHGLPSDPSSPSRRALPPLPHIPRHRRHPHRWRRGPADAPVSLRPLPGPALAQEPSQEPGGTTGQAPSQADAGGGTEGGAAGGWERVRGLGVGGREGGRGGCGHAGAVGSGRGGAAHPRAAAEPPGLPVLLLLRQERLLLHSGARWGCPRAEGHCSRDSETERDPPSLSQKQKRDSRSLEHRGTEWRLFALPQQHKGDPPFLPPLWHAFGKLSPEGRAPTEPCSIKECLHTMHPESPSKHGASFAGLAGLGASRVAKPILSEASRVRACPWPPAQVLCVCGPLCWTGAELVGVVPAPLGARGVPRPLGPRRAWGRCRWTRASCGP